MSITTNAIQVMISSILDELPIRSVGTRSLKQFQRKHLMGLVVEAMLTRDDIFNFSTVIDQNATFEELLTEAVSNVADLTDADLLSGYLMASGSEVENLFIKEQCYPAVRRQFTN